MGEETERKGKREKKYYKRKVSRINIKRKKRIEQEI